MAVAVFLFPDSKKATPDMVALATPATSTVGPVPTSRAGSNAPAMIAGQVRFQSPALAAQAGELRTDSSPPPELPPETVLQNVGRAIHQFGETFGGNPVGSNPEITSQLSGNNARHINFIDPQPGTRINANGELVDEWGTPYFFHQISGSEMEIHSAGPDKIMWTSDDLVVK
jgi:hypothetical protein